MSDKGNEDLAGGLLDIIIGLSASTIVGSVTTHLPLHVTDDTTERQLLDQQVRALLVLADLTESNNYEQVSEMHNRG